MPKRILREQIGQGRRYLTDAYFVDDVVRSCRGHISILKDTKLVVAQRQPLVRRRPGGRDDDHGKTCCAAEMHRSSIESKANCAETHQRSQLRQGLSTSYAR